MFEDAALRVITQPKQLKYNSKTVVEKLTEECTYGQSWLWEIRD